MSNHSKGNLSLSAEDFASLVETYENGQQEYENSYPESKPAMQIDWDSSNNTANSTYWSPVGAGTYGEFSPSEMQLAAAGFFNEGDVGNDIWRSARDLPFRDFDSELIGIGYNAMLLYAYEDHPDRQPKARKAEQFKEFDPSLRWALDEQIEAQLALSTAMQEQAPLETWAELNDRKYLLTTFIAEMMGYKEKIAQEHLAFVPMYYLDSLNQAMELGQRFDPKIVLEGGERSNLKSDPIAVTKLPSMQDVKVFHDIQDDYVIEGVREWGPAIIDGKQTFGPYGQKVATICLQKPNAREDGREVRDHRNVVLRDMLREHDVYNTRKGLVYRGNTSLEAATKQYANLAAEISAITSTNAAILQHRAELEAKLEKEAMIKIMKKWDVVLPETNSLGLPAGTYNFRSVLEQELQVSHVVESSMDEIGEAMENLLQSENEAGKYMDVLTEKIESKVSSTYYLLQTKLQWGWDVFQVTKDEELANEWRTARAEDIPYFKAPAAMQRKIENYSQALTRSGDTAEAERAALTWLSKTKMSKKVLSQQVNQFNNGHKVKKIQSQLDRTTGWLLSQMVFTTAQLKTARDGLRTIGAYIIKLRREESTPNSRLAFRRLQMVLNAKLKNWTPQDRNLTRPVLERILQGQVDMHFTWNIEPFKSDRQRNIMLRRKMCLSSEKEGYVNPTISFNKNIIDQTETFNLVRGFKPSKENQDIAAILLDKFAG